MNLNLLLLEDNEELAQLLIEELSANCYTVTWCKSLAEFNQAILNNHFLMIISDLNLPDGNSLDTLTKFKLKNPDIPVVVQTGDSSVSVAQKSFGVGALSFLEKPFRMSTITKLIYQYEFVNRMKQKNPNLAQMAKLSFKLSNL